MAGGLRDFKGMHGPGLSPRPVPAALETATAAAAVVCVDLDGTIVAGDLLWESYVDLLKRRPFRAIRMLMASVKGKAHFKRLVANDVAIDAASLPYREDLLQRLEGLRQQGARLVLATSADESYAFEVARHLGVFSDVVASDGRSNLTGRTKAAALAERYGQGGFHYVGNDWADVPVWRSAARGIAVEASPSLARHIVSTLSTVETSSIRPNTLRSLVRAMRPYQWIKNLLVFVPLIAAHKLFEPRAVVLSALTFVVFCLCASGVYLLNDILDIPSDRQHARKRLRPFAAGDLGVPLGLATSVGLLTMGLGLAIVGASVSLALVAGIYVATTSAYSLVLKRMPVTDVFVLTGLYVIRIVAGGLATATPLTAWLLAFALFLFLSLAFVKRYTELVNSTSSVVARGYSPADGAWVQAIGTSAGYMAVLVLALYVSAPEVAGLYRRPDVLWLLCPLLLYWLTRLWFRASRRMVHDDPLLEAARDPVAYLTAVVASVIMLSAI